MGSVEYYPLTYPQKGIWYTEKLYPGTSIGNIAGTVRIKNKVDYVLLEQAINFYLEENDSLRIRIIEENGEPRQYISQFRKTGFQLLDFCEKGIEGLKRWEVRRTRVPFKLIDTDLFHFTLIKLSENDGGFFVILHHLISDAWSIVQLVNRILEIYSRLVEGESPERKGNPSYIEYVIEEHNYENTEKFQRDKEFWESKFQTLPEATVLKAVKSDVKSTRAKRISYTVNKDLSDRIAGFCKENRISVFTLFFSAFYMYVNRLTSKEDIVLGTPVLNRLNFREKETSGMFISTVPVRVNTADSLSFLELVKTLSREWMSVLKHQRYPFDRILKFVREQFRTNDNPVNMSLSYQNAKFSKEWCGGKLETKWHFNGYQTVSLCLHISDREDEGILKLDYDYLPHLFAPGEIRQIHNHLSNIIEDILSNPHKKLFEISLLSDRERDRILNKFNNTQTGYPDDKTIHRIFEEAVVRTPHENAVVFEGRNVTYNDLNVRANQIGRGLRDLGVKPGSVVGLMAEKSVEMAAGILGILKSGGAYLPLDPECPQERISYMLKDSGARIVLATRQFEKRLADISGVLYFEDNCFPKDGSNPDNINSPDDLAYVIYTSGSTGTPKGVMVEHRSVVNLCCWFGKNFINENNKNVIQITNYTFDVSVEEILGSLLNGAALFIPRKEVILDKRLFIDFLKSNNINLAQFVPATLKELISDEEKVESLNTIICGGEALEEPLKDAVLSKGYILYNNYGPTEATVDATSSLCTSGRISIGKPIDNVKCYILDKRLNIQPVGVPGELMIAGAGVARGYINKPGQTAERFIDNPFNPGEKLYRTGDLARWLPGGDIEYLGRMDHQVKIRGHRIELFEIKLRLLRHKGVKDAVVIDRTGGDGSKYLAAYVVPRDKGICLKDGNDMYHVHTIEQRPYLRPEIDKLHSQAWPDFFAGDSVQLEYWPHIYDTFPSYQFVIMDDNGSIVAAGNTVPLQWDGSREDLPEGWDDAMERAFRHQRENRRPNAICAVAGAVNADSKNKRISYQIVKAFKLIASFHGLKYAILPVRPTLKEKYPYVSIEEYASFRREDGEFSDSWMRVHDRLGAKIIGFSPKSQKITGTIGQWEMWTGRKFPVSGEYIVRGAMQPVEIDVEKDLGVYYDQAIWVYYPIEKWQSYGCGNVLTVASLRKHLEKRMPYYMIPTYFIFMDKLPLMNNGKVDVQALPDVQGREYSEFEYIPPKNIVEEKLCNIWRDVLHLGKVGVADNFFDIGGDSLAVIRAQVRAYAEGFSLSTQDFYRFPTIRQLACRIMGGIRASQPESRADLCNMTAAADECLAETAAHSVQQTAEREGEDVLLTGATGFLGIHILREILEGSGKNVCCIVRGPGKKAAEEKLLNMLEYYFKGKYKELLGNRIHVLNGDIGVKRLGLRDEEYDRLVRNVGTVIHSAALVKHFGSYSEFEASNVKGTRNVIRLCRENCAQFNHISTLSVSGDYLVGKGSPKGRFSEKDYYIGQDFNDNVYVKSKFEAEGEVFDAIRSGLDARIFRVGNLTARYSDGLPQININENAFISRIKSIVLLGAAPDNILPHKIDLTPVDMCSKAIYGLIEKTDAAGRVFHLYNTNLVTVGEIIAEIGSMGKKIKILNRHEFKLFIENALKDAGKLEALSGLINDIGVGGRLDYTPMADIDSGYTVKCLTDIGFRWPLTGKDYMKKIFGGL